MTLLRWMDLRPRESAWEPQLLLRRARVLLVGLGGTGSAAARDLVASGVGRLHCVEPDVVELSNLNRQTLVRETDLGTPRIDAALSALHALNSDTTVTGERREVRGPSDLEDLLAGGAPRYDLLLLAADRPPVIRRWANRVCLASGVPWAEAGYRGPLVSVGVFTPGRGACWECLRSAEIERRDLRLAPGQDEEAASPRMPWNPVNAVTAGLSGGLAGPCRDRAAVRDSAGRARLPVRPQRHGPRRGDHAALGATRRLPGLRDVDPQGHGPR